MKNKTTKKLNKKTKTKARAKSPTKKVQAIPAGYSTVTPGFAAVDCHKAIEFLKSAFGAKVKHLFLGPDQKVMHCELRVGDTVVMCGEPQGERHSLRAMIYVKNCDAVFHKALASGGTAKGQLTDQFYGDRTGTVVDPCGNEWTIATHIEDVSKKEMDRRMKRMMSGQSAA